MPRDIYSLSKEASIVSFQEIYQRVAFKWVINGFKRRISCPLTKGGKTMLHGKTFNLNHTIAFVKPEKDSVWVAYLFNASHVACKYSIRIKRPFVVYK